MATPVGRIESSPYSLPDLRRRPDRSFFYTGPLDPVATKVGPYAYANRLSPTGISRDPDVLNKLERPTALGDNNNKIKEKD